MKVPVLLSILLLGAACAPVGLPAAEPSPRPIATQTSTGQAALVASPTGTPAPSTPLFEGIVDNVAVDRQGQVYASGFGLSWEDGRQFARWDGARWNELGNGFQTAGNTLVVDQAGFLYTDILVDSNRGSATAIVRWDGAGWEEITGNFSTVVDALQAGRISSNIPLAALGVDGDDRLYAAGSFQYPGADYTAEWPMGLVATWDGEAWTVLGHGFDRVHLYAMAVGPAGRVVVSGEQPRILAGEYGMSGFLAEWDGAAWTEIRTGKLDSCWSITHLALDRAGGLYASCTGSGPGALIFYRDGADWTLIADRLQGEAPAVFDMAVDQNGRLYTGGSFDSVSGVPARNIAYWDGALWHTLGDGVDGQVYALATDPGGGLYAAGNLKEAGGLPVDHVARWDGETWHALGPYMSGQAPAPSYLEINGQSQTARVGSYCWDYLDANNEPVGACLDSIGISTPIEPLPAEKTITAQFSLPYPTPPDRLSLRVFAASSENEIPLEEGADLRLWNYTDGIDRELDLQPRQEIKIELEPGLYVFYISAGWDAKGEVIYGFLVEVK